MRSQTQTGFSLIELMIAVVVIGILAAIAIPNYSRYVMRGKRADGQTSLMKVQSEQEKYRANHSTYGTLNQLALGATSTDGNYSIAISGTSATGYTASAAPNGSQANDSCGTLTLTVAAGNITYGPTSACWGR